MVFTVLYTIYHANSDTNTFIYYSTCLNKSLQIRKTIPFSHNLTCLRRKVAEWIFHSYLREMTRIRMHFHINYISYLWRRRAVVGDVSSEAVSHPKQWFIAYNVLLLCCRILLAAAGWTHEFNLRFGHRLSYLLIFPAPSWCYCVLIPTYNISPLINTLSKFLFYRYILALFQRWSEIYKSNFFCNLFNNTIWFLHDCSLVHF